MSSLRLKCFTHEVTEAVFRPVASLAFVLKRDFNCYNVACSAQLGWLSSGKSVSERVPVGHVSKSVLYHCAAALKQFVL